MSPRVHHGTLVQVGCPSARPAKGSHGKCVIVSEEFADMICNSSSVPLVVNHNGTPLGVVTRLYRAAKTVDFDAVAYGPLPHNRVSYGAENASLKNRFARIWTIVSGELTEIAVVAKGAHEEAVIS